MYVCVYIVKEINVWMLLSCWLVRFYPSWKLHEESFERTVHFVKEELVFSEIYMKTSHTLLFLDFFKDLNDNDGLYEP